MKKLIYFLGIILTVQSCQVGQYYTAKTLKKGEKQILLGGESYLAPVASLAINGTKDEALIYSIPMHPTLHFNWGTDKKRDHTFELSIAGQLSYATKFQLVGTNDSKFAMAIRPQIGVGTYPFITDGQQFWSKVPLVFTKEFGKKSSITVSPGFMFSLPGKKYGQSNFQRAMFFSSFTYHLGKKNRLFISYSFMSVKYLNSFDITNMSSQMAFGYIWRWKKKDKTKSIN